MRCTTHRINYRWWRERLASVYSPDLRLKTINILRAYGFSKLWSSYVFFAPPKTSYFIFEMRTWTAFDVKRTPEQRQPASLQNSMPEIGLWLKHRCTRNNTTLSRERKSQFSWDLQRESQYNSSTRRWLVQSGLVQHKASVGGAGREGTRRSQ